MDFTILRGSEVLFYLMWLVSQLQQNIETLLILYIGSMQETDLVWTNLMPNRSGKVKIRTN